jgi:hypothetical protein
MAYQPKSQYKILKTLGGEYVYRGTETYHVGSYIKLSNGKYFAGNDLINKGKELTLYVSLPKNFSRDIKTQIYNKLKPQKFLFLKNVKPLINTTPLPTNKDYAKGSFIRYFAKKNNIDGGYVEIDKKTYESIFKKKKEYDHNLYQVGKLTWALEGNVIDINDNILSIKEAEFPYISDFFDMLDKHKKIKAPQHNIKGRYYSNGVAIPVMLPPSYNKTKVLNQYCNNCIFNVEGYCNKWEANIKTEYWCKSYKSIKKKKTTRNQYTTVKNFKKVKSYQQTTNPTFRSSTDIQTSGGDGGTSYSGGGGY